MYVWLVDENELEDTYAQEFPCTTKMNITIKEKTRCSGPSTENSRRGNYCFLKISWYDNKIFTGFEFDHWITCIFITQHLEKAFNEFSKNVENPKARDKFPYHANILSFFKEKYIHIDDYKQRIATRRIFILDTMNNQWYPQQGYCKTLNPDYIQLTLGIEYTSFSESNHKIYHYVYDLSNIDLYIDDIFERNLR